MCRELTKLSYAIISIGSEAGWMIRGCMSLYLLDSIVYHQTALMMDATDRFLAFARADRSYRRRRLWCSADGIAAPFILIA